MAHDLKITQTRSSISANPKQEATLRSLGLGRIGSTAERKETDQLRGQIRVIEHLVQTEEVS